MKNISISQRLFFLLLVLAGLSSCEERGGRKTRRRADPAGRRRLGLCQPGPYAIGLSTTAPYFNNQPAPGARGAEVTITDNEGNRETLQEAEPGKYLTQTLRGKTGNSYTLNIKWNGEEYTARTRINRVPAIDSLGIRFRKGGGFMDEGYYITSDQSRPA